MIRWSSLLFLLMLSFSQLKAQNLYDEEHTSRFAEYLFQSQQFDLASQEYERLLFMNTTQPYYKLQLVKSYRKAGKIGVAENRFLSLVGDSLHSVSEPFAQEYMHLLMLQNKLPEAKWYLNSNRNISELQGKYDQLQLSLLARNWKKADSIASQIPNLTSGYASIIKEGNSMKHRSPGVAMAFSMVIPGTGKVYSSYWKDGIISFLFVAATGWQAYRGFDQKGASSVSGWIWGSISTGFYLGNIYGSYKAAKRFNERQNQILHKRASDYIYSTF